MINEMEMEGTMCISLMEAIRKDDAMMEGVGEMQGILERNGFSDVTKEEALMCIGACMGVSGTLTVLRVQATRMIEQMIPELEKQIEQERAAATN